MKNTSLALGSLFLLLVAIEMFLGIKGGERSGEGIFLILGIAFLAPNVILAGIFGTFSGFYFNEGKRVYYIFGLILIFVFFLIFFHFIGDIRSLGDYLELVMGIGIFLWQLCMIRVLLLSTISKPPKKQLHEDRANARGL